MAYRLRQLMACMCLAAAVLGGAAPGRAQEVDRVAAVVNDEAITMLELDGRVRLALLSSNIPDSVDARRRIVPQMLRKIIEERLQIQEAKRLKITVAKEDLQGAVATVEKQNNLPPGGLKKVLADGGVPFSALEQQLEAEIAWAKVMRLTMLPRVKIGDDEINDHLEMLREAQGRPEYLLAEIVLGVDDPANETEVMRAAERILAQIRDGVPFSGLARQFSQSPSAAQGGDLQWVPQNALEPEVADVVARAMPGSVTAPLRTIEGYQILLVRDRRIAGQRREDPNATVALAQALVPAGTNRDAARRKAEEIAAQAKNCNDIETLARDQGLPQSGKLGTLKVADLPDGLRAVLAGLDVMQASKPLESPDGFRVMMVCGRSGGGPTGGLPSREEVQRQIEQKRLDLMSRRFLRELRRAAFVEVRL